MENHWKGGIRMNQITEEELERAFHMMWEHYPEPVRLIHRSFRVVAGNDAYLKTGGVTGVKCNVGDPAFHRGCQAMNALKTGEAKLLRTEVEGMPWTSYWIPVEGAADYFIHFTDGISATIAKKLAETKEG
jgi:hypothetical protein